jgi:hypothetical protein
MTGHNSAGPRIGGIATFCLADPGVSVGGNIDRSIVIKKADDAIAVARADGTGRFVLLLQAFIADIRGIAGRALISGLGSPGVGAVGVGAVCAYPDRELLKTKRPTAAAAVLIPDDLENTLIYRSPPFNS